MIRKPEEVIRTVDVLAGERSNWESQWQEQGDYLIPRKNDINNFKEPGTKRNFQVLDNTGMTSCELLAGALQGLLLNPTSTFFEYITGDRTLDDRDDVRKWLEDTTIRTHIGLNQTNFHPEASEFLLDIVGFCTASMSIMEDEERDMVFKAHFLKEIHIKENNKGLVDEVYRVFNWSAKEIVQEFGKKVVTDKILQYFEEGRTDKFVIIHATYPADPLGEKKKGFRQKYVSQYILRDEKVDLRVRGYNEYPWVVARWAKASGEAYGRGPGTNAMPEVKMVNLMEETIIRGAQKTIDPPLQSPDDGFVLPIKTRPGSVNFYRSGSKDRIEPIFNDARIDFGEQVMASRRQRIREAFYVDQLQLGQGPQMTATEVTTRTEEKLKFLGPLLGRLQVEFLGPMIDRVFNIMLRRGRFLPPPPILQGKLVGVQYSSAIAKIQRASEVQNVMQVVGAIQPFVALDQSAADHLDVDAIVRGIPRMLSFPQKFIRDQDEVKKIRDARAAATKKALDEQSQMNDANVVSKTVPAVAQAQQIRQQQQQASEEEI